MKAFILGLLKTKFQGVSDAILGRVAEKIAKTATTEAEATTAVEGVTTQQLLESYGDSRATEAQQSAVANYEKKHNLKNGKPVETTPAPPTEPKPTETPSEPKADDTPAWARELIADNKAMKQQLGELRGERTASQRKSRLDALLKDVPEAVRTRYQKDFSRMTFKDDDDFDAWVADVTPDVESIKSDFQSKGGTLTPPRGGSGTPPAEKPNPIVEARIKERQAATSTPAIQGLTPPTTATK